MSHSPPVRIRVFLVTVVAVLVTAMVYGYSARLPLFFDDMLHFRWVDGHSLAETWLTAEGLMYYRPLTLFIWKLSHILLGRFDPLGLHILNLVLHALNGCLLGLLAYRLFEGEARLFRAVTVTLLFVTYPFSYQVVPYVGALFHPLVTALILGSVTLYWEGQWRGNRPLLVASLGLAAAAPLAHEYGVLAGLLVGLVEVVRFRRERADRLSPLPLVYVALGLVFVGVWFLAPKTRAPFQPPTMVGLWQSGVYFLQGLIWPAAPLGRALSGKGDAFLVVLLVALAILTLLVVFLVRSGQRTLLWLSSAWFALSVAPAWLMLDAVYVLDSPRLLYLASVGVALLWGGVIAGLSNSRLRPEAQPEGFGRLAAVALLVAILIGNVVFLHRASAPYLVISRMASQVMAASETHPADEVPPETSAEGSLLFIGVPSWFGYEDTIYPLGSEGITFIPNDVTIKDVVWVNGGGDRRAVELPFTYITKPWRVDYRFYKPLAGWEEVDVAVRRAIRVYVVDYNSNDLALRQAGMFLENSESAGFEAVFGEHFVLEQSVARLSPRPGARPPDRPPAPPKLGGTGGGGTGGRGGDVLTVILDWRCLRPVEGDYTVFVHLYDVTGRLVAQGDGHPLLGVFPFLLWRAGDRVRDVRTIVLPAQLALSLVEGSGAGPLTLVLGVFNVATGQRLEAVDDDGHRLPDDAAIIGAVE